MLKSAPSSRVLLAHSNHLYHDRKQVEKMQPYPPLQTMLAASVLRQAGLDVALCDVTFDDPDAAIQQAFDAARPRLLVVCEDDFNFLSKMCLGRNRELSFRMAAAAKERGMTAAVHGSDSSDNAARYLDSGFDYVLIGEVEATLLELAQGMAPEQISGLAFRDSRNAVRYTPPRALRTELDSLPIPAWDLVDVEQYREHWLDAHGYFSLNLVSSRGCPHKCNWCAKPIWGDAYHVRSPRLVAQDMRFVKERYQPDHIWFSDDIFALSGNWTLEFAAAVEALDAAIPFKMQSRCDLMTRDTVAALRRAGCREVWMGAESGSQKILDAMEKGQRVESIYQSREHLQRHGIRACFFLQFGYPGESWPEIEATIRMVRETRPDDIGVSVSYPLPGTKFHQLVSAQLGAKSNWTDSADLAMMFRGAYSSEFYRALACALHLEVRSPERGGEIRAAWERVYELEGSLARTVLAAS
jgi:anaerobic magnesium-protoporphyrin IX monomethyl ester cyclase